MDTTQSIRDILPEGYEVRPRRQRAGVISMGPHWVITGPEGHEEAVTSVALVAYAVRKIEGYMTPAAPAPAAPAPAPDARPARTRSTCSHSDTDNNGVCYSCGHYDRRADVGQTFRRYTIR